MEKKQYIVSMTDVLLLDTSVLMKASGTSPELPPGPGNNAPARRTDVF